MFGDRISTQRITRNINLIKSTVTYLYETKVLNTTRDFTQNWQGRLYVNRMGMGMGAGGGGETLTEITEITEISIHKNKKIIVNKAFEHIQILADSCSLMENSKNMTLCVENINHIANIFLSIAN